MVENRVNKFVELINERRAKIEEHYNLENWSKISKLPEEKYWYEENIASLDKEIVQVANSIIQKFNIPSKLAKNIEDVYANYWLSSILEAKKQEKNTKEENSSRKNSI